MQGRLVPPEPDRFQAFPRSHWRDEFLLAAKVPLDYIEWIVDEYGADVNPLFSIGGVSDLLSLSRTSGVRIRSVCADYFMDNPLVRCSLEEYRQRETVLHDLIRRSGMLGVNRIVLPFVDASSMKTDDDQQRVITVVSNAVPIASDHNVELHLETDLDAPGFARFLQKLPFESVGVNYDSGNSASLGYKVDDEFQAYGSRIRSVHIKDRVRGGGTVPLGTGNADFPALFSAMQKVGYQGDITLQVARSISGDEVNWAVANRAFVTRFWPVNAA
jgi:hexulose-6-phosphate isomerase